MADSDPSRSDGSATPIAWAVAVLIASLFVIVLGTLSAVPWGDLDDKTTHFATSAVSPSKISALRELSSHMPQILARCGDHPNCRWRTRTRVTSLGAYPLSSTLIRVSREYLVPASTRFCEVVGRANLYGFTLLHLGLCALVLGTVATDRSSGRTFTALVVMLVGVAALHSPAFDRPEPAWLQTLLAGAFPETPPQKHSMNSYVPRGALGFALILSAAALASGRHLVWAGLAVVLSLTHLAQGTILNAILLAASILVFLLGVDRSVRLRIAISIVFGIEIVATIFYISTSSGLGLNAKTSPLLHAIDTRAVVFALGSIAAFAYAATGRARPAWRRRYAAVLCSMLSALFVLRIGSAWLSQVPVAKIMFDRLYGNLWPFVASLPLLAVAIAGEASSRAARLPSIAAALVMILLALQVARSPAALERAWERSRFKWNTLPRELCQSRRMPVDTVYRGVESLEPSHETRFNLQVYDLLSGERRRIP